MTYLSGIKRCPRCKEVLPDYPTKPGSCSCGASEWHFWGGGDANSVGTIDLTRPDKRGKK